jgi:hypothetical protein
MLTLGVLWVASGRCLGGTLGKVPRGAQAPLRVRLQCEALGHVLWVWMLFQVLTSSMRAAVSVGALVSPSGGVPPWLLDVFTALLYMQFDYVGSVRGCSDGYLPFSAMWVPFGALALCLAVLLVCTALFAATAGPHRQRQHSSLAPSESSVGGTPGATLSFSWSAALRKRCLYPTNSAALCALLGVYAVVTNAAIRSVACMEPPAYDVRAYLALQGDGRLISTAPSLAPYQPYISAPGVPGALDAFVAGALPLSSLPPGLAANVTAILSAPLKVKVLVFSPNIACYEGAHVPLWWASSYVLLFALGFPLASLILVRFVVSSRLGAAGVVGEGRAEAWRKVHENWLPWVATLNGVCCGQRAGGGCVWLWDDEPGKLPPPPSEGEDSDALGRSPFALDHGGALSAAECSTRATALVNSTPLATATPLLRPWTVGDREPAYFFLRPMDQLLILALACASIASAVPPLGDPLNPPGLSMPYLIAVYLGSLLVVGGALAFNLLLKPFPPGALWKERAVSGTLVLAALALTLSFAQAGGAGGEALTALAVLLLVGYGALFSFILISAPLAIKAAAEKAVEGLLAPPAASVTANNASGSGGAPKEVAVKTKSDDASGEGRAGVGEAGGIHAEGEVGSVNAENPLLPGLSAAGVALRFPEETAVEQGGSDRTHSHPFAFTSNPLRAVRRSGEALLPPPPPPPPLPPNGLARLLKRTVPSTPPPEFLLRPWWESPRYASRGGTALGRGDRK